MDMAEQLCYIPCSYCNIILAVSVPCSSLFDVVTVRCGHCANLWTVNMAAAFHPSSSSFPPDLHLQGGLSNYTPSEYRVMEQLGSSSKWNYSRMPMPMPMQMQQLPSTFINKPDHRIINRPPEKRQRVPSAYNQFIKEEIQRIKANNPDISHREAFSTAAKNWAHFPHIHFGLMLESKNQADKLDEGGSDKHQLRRAAAALLNN